MTLRQFVHPNWPIVAVIALDALAWGGVVCLAVFVHSHLTGP